MANVLVVGLNPAWQKIMEFDGLRPGEVNRARSLSAMASGKGMNAAKVLGRLGHEVSLLQILGGENGRRCLAECSRLGLRSLHVMAERETRECHTLADARDGSATEIIEPFALDGPDPGEALLAVLPEAAGAFEAVVFAGSIPPGGPAGLFGKVLDRCRPRVSVLDSRDGREVAERVTCVKVNRAEYGEMSGGGEGGTLFLVTGGGEDAAMLRGGEILASYGLPALTGLRNPIGAGDTVTAGVAHFLLAGLEPAEAFRRALAMGSASCLQSAPAEYREEDFRRLLSLIEFREAGGRPRG